MRSWIEVVDDLRRKRGLSLDDLAYEARRFGAPKSLNASWLSRVRRGDRPLTVPLLEGLAGALGVPPETFIEYRLALARRELDEREVGLEVAARNLGAGDDPITAALDELVDAEIAAAEESPSAPAEAPGKAGAKGSKPRAA